jgi:hypothetical protein
MVVDGERLYHIFIWEGGPSSDDSALDHGFRLGLQKVLMTLLSKIYRPVVALR